MRIASLRIKNFRCVLDQTIDIDNLTALVGSNGAGKSTIVRAISAFYETSSSLRIEDYYNKRMDDPIEISLSFTEFSPQEEELFAHYVHNGSLTVTKKIDQGKERYFGMRRQNQDFADVRKKPSKAERLKEYRELRNQDTYRDLAVVRSADNAEEQMAGWEAEHPDSCRMLQDEGQFFGFREVGQARLERFTRFVFVPAVRDAERDAADARGSAIFQLMELVVRKTLAQNEAYIDFKSRFQKEFSELFVPENAKQLSNLSGRLTRVLRQYVPSAKVKLDWQTSDELDVPLPKTKVELVEDGFAAPVDRVGHGLQRAFIVSLLQSLVAVDSNARNQSMDQEAASATEEMTMMPDLILGIEEPELYQHPNRQRHLSSILWALSKGEIPGVARRTQVIYCTHSPLFVDLARFDCLRRVTKVKNANGADLPLVSEVKRNSLERVAERLAVAQEGRRKATFTADSLRARMGAIMTPWRNEGFFGDAVILVEGEDDRSALLGAAALMGLDLEAEGIAVIPVGGKDSLDKPYLVFTGLEISTYVVFDGDAHAKEKDKPKHAKVNTSLQRLLGVAEPVHFPNTKVNSNFAVFEKNIDVLLKERVGNVLYERVIETFKVNYGYIHSSQCRKSPVFVRLLLQEARKEGIDVSELHDIVRFARELLA